MGLFALQHFGTRRVGFLFAPILLAWLFCISVIGIYNIIHWNPHVVSALSPYYVYNFFKKARKDGWNSLGGVVLCITGLLVIPLAKPISFKVTLIIIMKFPSLIYQVQRPCLLILVTFRSFLSG